jgi:hypothetical protein
MSLVAGREDVPRCRASAKCTREFGCTLLDLDQDVDGLHSMTDWGEGFFVDGEVFPPTSGQRVIIRSATACAGHKRDAQTILYLGCYL